MVERAALKNRIKKAVPISEFTTFHIGGEAENFIEVVTEDELVEALGMAHEEGIPAFLMGGGSNLVVSDRGMGGLTILNRSANPDIIDLERNQVTVSSGRWLGAIVELAKLNGLSGMETLTGIPGTVGGAVYGNAGAYGKSIADLLMRGKLFNPATGQVIVVDKTFFEFQYRASALKTSPFVLLNCTFRLQPGDRAAIKAQMDDIIVQRHSKHPPLGVGSAGSFFKNLPPLPGDSRRRAAGEVLEKAGAKSMAVGGASVFHKHANFIVNYGKATAEDVRALAKMMHDKVLEMFNIPLEEEVLYVGR